MTEAPDRGWVCTDPDCPGPPVGQGWCLHRDTEEWRRWLDGELTTPEATCQHGCHDLKPDEADCNWWELVVDEGRATVRCATCKCTYDPLTWDGAELLYTDLALPVQVHFDHCGSEWHGENRCDHGWTIGVSPRKRS